jgi:ribosome biogenesis protein Tsr3
MASWVGDRFMANQGGTIAISCFEGTLSNHIARTKIDDTGKCRCKLFDYRYVSTERIDYVSFWARPVKTTLPFLAAANVITYIVLTSTERIDYVFFCARLVKTTLPFLAAANVITYMVLTKAA